MKRTWKPKRYQLDTVSEKGCQTDAETVSNADPLLSLNQIKPKADAREVVTHFKPSKDQVATSKSRGKAKSPSGNLSRSRDRQEAPRIKPDVDARFECDIWEEYPYPGQHGKVASLAAYVELIDSHEVTHDELAWAVRNWAAETADWDSMMWCSTWLRDGHWREWTEVAEDRKLADLNERADLAGAPRFERFDPDDWGTMGAPRLTAAEMDAYDRHEYEL